MTGTPAGLAENLPVFAWRFDAGGALTWTNAAWQIFCAATIGGPPAGWSDQVLHPDDATALGAALAAARVTEAGVLTTFRVKPADGGDDAYHPVLWRFRRERDERGIASGWIAIGTDLYDLGGHRLHPEASVNEMRQNDLVTIAETIPVIVWRSDAQGFNNYFNAAWYAYTGLTPEQSHGTGWTTPIHPDDVARAEEAWYNAIHHGRPFDIEYRMLGRNGTYHWFLSRSRPLRGVDGSVTNWFGTSTDVHEQRVATEALEAAKMRAEFLAGADRILERSFAAPHLIADLARHAVEEFTTLCFYDAGDTGSDLTRLAAIHRDLAIQRSWDATAPGIAPWRIARLPQAVAAGSEAHLTTHVTDEWVRAAALDGEHEVFLRGLHLDSAIAVPVIARGRRFGVMTFGRTLPARPFDEHDLATAQELARRAAVSLENARLYALARDNERHAAAIADAVPQIFWTARADGHIDWFNRGWYEYTGQTVESAAGWGWRAVHHPHDAAAVNRRWQASLRNGEPFEMSFRLRGADGTFRWFLTRIVPQRDENGTIVRWYGSNTNVDSERRATLQLALFATLGEALTSLPTVGATLEAVVKSLVPGFADLALVELRDESGIRLAAVEHRDPRAAGATLDIATAQAGGDALFAVARAAILAHRAMLSGAGRSRLADVSYTSALAAPLIVDGVVRGVLTLAIVDEAGAFTDADLPFVQEIARRIAPALAKAEIYERERRIAETFQNAVLPRRLPAIAGLRFDALYEPGKAESLVGGDWFDAFRLADGRVVVTIGDVIGNGLAAATAMAEVRQSIRGAAAINADPPILLDAADHVLAENGDDRYATAWVGIVDPIDFSIRYASAGHPPPLVRDPDGSVRSLGGDGLPLGLAPSLSQHRNGRTTYLAPGSVLTLFTDGLIESERDALRGEALLCTALAGEQPQTVTARKLRNAVLGSGTAHDDVAILVVSFLHRLAEAHGDDRTRRWRFDVSDARAAGTARRELAALLARHGLARTIVATAEMILGELLGNVVRYAPGPVDVILDRTGAIPVLHVIDEGDGFDYHRRLPADAYAESGRGLFIVAELAREFSIRPAPHGGSHVRVVLETREAMLAAAPP